MLNSNSARLPSFSWDELHLNHIGYICSLQRVSQLKHLVKFNKVSIMLLERYDFRKCRVRLRELPYHATYSKLSSEVLQSVWLEYILKRIRRVWLWLSMQ